MSDKLKTRVIVELLPDGGATWRAPIKDGRYASVELRPMELKYTDEKSAESAGKSLVRSVFPDIEFE